MDTIDNDSNNTDIRSDNDTYSEKRCRELCLKTLKELKSGRVFQHGHDRKQ